VLITFEGIDGCGKSTQIQLLREYLEIVGIDYHVFREPGGTALSEEIRNLLLHSTGEMDPVTELLLFSAARSQLIAEKVKPLLERGEVVILDRFYDSTTAYQGYGRQSADPEKIMELNRIASHGCVPDITFYLKIDPELAAERTRDGVKDRMERSGDGFFKKVIEGYEKLAEQEKRFVVIDASQSPKAIHDAVKNQFLKQFRPG
jgi:dTMP kinase